jgi:hypothetical protein
VAGRFEQYAQHVPHLVIVVDDSHDARIISIHADDFPATATRVCVAWLADYPNCPD